MTQQEFSQEIGRLLEQFGKNSFGNERAKLLWREIGSFEARWLNKVIDALISNSRASPVIADFYPFITEERERRWKIEKEKNTRESEGFWKITSTNEERQLMLHTIRERVKKNVNDQDWKCFMDLINTRFGT